ncbi:MAG: M23 family metallopeptidase [Alistipes sp.]|nr:M23 family metallopeptidase [Alistipes sp.]
MGIFNKKKADNQERSLIHRLRTYRLFRTLLIGFIVIALFNMLFSSLFYTPKMLELSEERSRIEYKNKVLLTKIRSSQNQIDQIRQRDNNVYRPLFSSDTFYIEGIHSPYAEQKYAWMKDLSNRDMLHTTWLQMDQLARSLYLSSKSLDELQKLSREKENFSTSIPAIWPIDRSRLRGGIGAFGYRIHPILKYRKMHQGVDLGGKIGDPVYTTGDGIIETVVLSRARTSYGTQIVVNHGFGYKTRYAHLDKVFVEQGDTVSRGELIAEMGNTGISTAPHLHYEVIYKGSVVNPINYFDKDMSTEAYKSLMGQIQEENYEGE